MTRCWSVRVPFAVIHDTLYWWVAVAFIPLPDRSSPGNGRLEPWFQPGAVALHTGASRPQRDRQGRLNGFWPGSESDVC